MPRDEMIEVSVSYVHHTLKAILVDDGDREVWLPRSQIQMEHDIRELNPGSVITLEVPEWLAEKNDLV